jgi:MFS family permease
MLTARLTWDRLLPTYYGDLGATDQQIGTAFSLFAAIMALFQFVGGLLADRVGRKPVAVLPILGLVGIFFWMAAVGSWQQLIVAHMAFATLASIQSPGFSALLAESVPAKERGRAFGIVSTGGRVARAAGPALGAVLLAFAPLPTLLRWTAVVAIGVTVVRLFLLRETMEAPSSPRPAHLRMDRSQRRFALRFLAIGGLFAAFTNLLFSGPFLTLHADQALALSDSQINSLFALGNLAGIGAALGGRWLADQLGRRPSMIIGVALQAAGILAWSVLPPGLPATACFVVATAGGPVAHVAYNAILTGVIEGRRRGAFLGLMGTLSGLIGSPTSRIAAELRALWGTTAPFWAALILAAILALALSIEGLRRRKENGRNTRD